ncbi:MAG: murein biosynthesis integral membrane protein MurJ [Streptosporangiaceae bacterium]
MTTPRRPAGRTGADQPGSDRTGSGRDWPAADPAADSWEDEQYPAQSWPADSYPADAYPPDPYAGRPGDGRYDDAQHGQAQHGQAQHGQAQHDESRYDDGRYDDGQYDQGRYGEGRYDDAQHGQAQYGQAQHDESRYDDGRYDDGGRQPGRFPAPPAGNSHRPAAPYPEDPAAEDPYEHLFRPDPERETGRRSRISRRGRGGRRPGRGGPDRRPADQDPPGPAAQRYAQAYEDARAHDAQGNGGDWYRDDPQPRDRYREAGDPGNPAGGPEDRYLPAGPPDSPYRDDQYRDEQYRDEQYRGGPSSADQFPTAAYQPPPRLGDGHGDSSPGQYEEPQAGPDVPTGPADQPGEPGRDRTAADRFGRRRRQRERERDWYAADLNRDPSHAPDWRSAGPGQRDTGTFRVPPSMIGPGWSAAVDETMTGELARIEFGAAEPGPVGLDDTGAALAADSAAAETGSGSILRSSGVMAAGSLASRLSGFVRTMVQAYALGAAALADAYNNANTLPNVVYNLMLGGILTSVIVPLLVNAAKRNRGRNDAYDQRMFTLTTLALVVLTVVATAAAAPIVYLYKGDIEGPELHLMVIFAYFFIPQILFYGVSSMAGAILNARGRFAAPMWTPVINNIVVIVVLLLFLAVAHPGVSPATITTGEVRLLGWGTTLGIVAQTVALIPALRRAGFRWRPRFDFRRDEVGEIGRMAGWMFGYIATTQVAFLVTTRLANDAAERGEGSHIGIGYTVYTYAWQLFQMPYAIVGISVITALLPRMSAHAAERRLSLVTDDFSLGVRLSSVIVVPAALVLAVLGPSLAQVLLAHGNTSLADASYIGEVFGLFCLGLVPYMLFQLQLRVFYAMHDSRTPALIGVATMVVNIATNIIAYQLLPPDQVVAGLGVGFGLANLIGAVAAWRILSRRLHGLDGRRIGASLLRMHASAIPAAIFAVAAGVLINVVIGPGHLRALVISVLGGGGALFFYVLFARALELPELTDLTATIRGRIGR